MAYTVYYGVKFHPDFKLLWPGFAAITLFGHVFTRKSKENLALYMKTDGGKIMANHERIHMMQVQSFRLKYFTFYILYIGQWIRGLFKYGRRSYKNIPFEREAYGNEKDLSYISTRWKDYKDKNLKN